MGKPYPPQFDPNRGSPNGVLLLVQLAVIVLGLLLLGALGYGLRWLISQPGW